MRLRNIALTAVLLSGYGFGAAAGEDLPYQAAVFDAGTGPADKKVIRLFPVKGGKESDIELPGSIRVLAVAPGGRVLYASPTPDPTVLQPPAPGLFAVDLRPVGKRLLPGSSGFVFPTSMAVSSDGKKLLVSGAAMVDGNASCGVYELIPATGAVRKIVSAMSCQREEAWSSLSFSNDGSHATAIHRKRLEVIDLSSGEIATVGDGFYGAAWSPDGKWIAAREYSGQLRTVILDARTFSRVRTLQDAEMLWSPDSRYLLSFRQMPSCVLEFYTLDRIDIQSGRSSPIDSSRCKAAGGQAAWVSAALKP
jgi:WD40 repeat protein